MEKTESSPLLDHHDQEKASPPSYVEVTDTTRHTATTPIQPAVSQHLLCLLFTLYVIWAFVLFGAVLLNLCAYHQSSKYEHGCISNFTGTKFYVARNGQELRVYDFSGPNFLCFVGALISIVFMVSSVAYERPIHIWISVGCTGFPYALLLGRWDGINNTGPVIYDNTLYESAHAMVKQRGGDVYYHMLWSFLAAAPFLTVCVVGVFTYVIMSLSACVRDCFRTCRPVDGM